MARHLLHRSLVALVAAVLATVSSAVSAQWVWKDDAGQVVASDQPPPVGTPAARILKQPRPRTASAPAPAEGAAKEAAGDGKGEAPKSLADRDLESKQRLKEQAEAAKKSDDDQARSRAMQENCNTVRGNLAGLQIGGRTARFNDKGERYYIDDAQRQTEIAKAQSQISQYCK